MRAELLKLETIKALAEAKDFEEFLKILSETPYGEKLSGMTPSAVDLERIFNQTFIKRLESVIEGAPKEISDFLNAYYYMELEIRNLKKIMRGKFSKMPSEWIDRSLIPMRPYLSIEFEKLLAAATLGDLVVALETTIYAPVREVLKICEEYDILWPLESWLDNIYINSIEVPLMRLIPEDKAIVKEVLQTRIDVENLLAAYNWSREFKGQTPPVELFTRIYKVSQETLRKLSEGANTKEVLQGLGSPYSEILAPLLKEEDTALVRKNLLTYIYSVAERSRIVKDFSFPCIFSLLVSFDIEKDDLVSLAWGKEQGVAPEKIMKYTVLPNLAK
jgi:vacuolar-type H+-ATPase subunit C/Vma6